MPRWPQAAVRVGGPSLAIGNQAEMMELEAAVIDGTRFLCYDNGAACRVGPVGGTERSAAKTIAAARRKCFSQRLSS